MKGKYSCPECGSNDWTPVLWVDGPPYDECKCGYKFTSKDVKGNPSFLPQKEAST